MECKDKRVFSKIKMKLSGVFFIIQNEAVNYFLSNFLILIFS